MPSSSSAPPSQEKPAKNSTQKRSSFQVLDHKLYLFVATDRTSKFAFTELHEKATTRIAADFLHALITAVPYKIHTVLTDNGTHFTTPANTSSAAPDIKLVLEKR